MSNMGEVMFSCGTGSLCVRDFGQLQFIIYVSFNVSLLQSLLIYKLDDIIPLGFHLSHNIKVCSVRI